METDPIHTKTDLLTSDETSIQQSCDSSLSKRKKVRLENYLRRKEFRRQTRKNKKLRHRLRLQEQKQHNYESSINNLKRNNDNNKQKPSNSNTNLSVIQLNESITRKALLNKPKMIESKCQTKVVLDCSFDHLMSFKDICKLANQVSKCYSINRRAESPVQLYVTGLGSPNTLQKDTDSSKETCTSQIRLYDRLKKNDCNLWDVNICEADFSTLFPKSSIVYLCAESDNILPDQFKTASNSNNSSTINNSELSFSSDDVYVIGGLVDHNQHIGYCYKQALNNGYRTARLPIKENISIKGRCVLSTFHVFQALSLVLTGIKTWSESLKLSIPPRKLGL